LGWISASWLGASTGSALISTEKWGLDFALPAMFIALLFFTLRNKRSYLVACLAGGFSLFAALYIPGNWGVLLAAILGATGGVISEKWIAE
jgi:predicted branched-subunit amino acid permease